MKHIEEKVNKIIKQHDTNDPYKIAKEKGIQIVFEELGNVFGYFSKHYQVKIIHINNKLKVAEKRFVCSHELGHAILHPDANTPFLKRKTLFSTNRIEQEANVFAMNLLFSETDLNEHIKIELALNKYGIPQSLLQEYHDFF